MPELLSQALQARRAQRKTKDMQAIINAWLNGGSSQHPPEVTSMPKPKAPPAVSGSAEDTETAFYEALQRADIEKLMACWADEDDIFCVHPGGPRLLGAGAIRAAFDAMFANGSIQARAEKVHVVESMGASVHSVLERIEVLTAEGPRHAYVIATNVYQKTAQGWRMVAHHASPGTPREMLEVSDTPPVLH